MGDLEGRSFFLTGANAGIGRATALALGARGATLYLAGRSQARTQEVLDAIRSAGNDAVTFFPLELSDLASVGACADAFLSADRPLDVLINNAGLAGHQGVTKDGFEVTFGVNHLGHFLLTERLTDRLKETAAGKTAPGRIVNVASKAHYRAGGIDWDALRRPTATTTGLAEYQVSKLCNVLHAKSLARRLEGANLRAYSLHPGVIASEVWRKVPWPIRPLMTAFMKSSEEGAATSLHCATSPAVAGDSGLYYDECREKEPSPLAHDRELADELWARSVEWAGIA